MPGMTQFMGQNQGIAQIVIPGDEDVGVGIRHAIAESPGGFADILRPVNPSIF